MKTFAFISYSRADIKIAHWLHKKLEKYPYPQNWVTEENRPYHDKFVRKIFIDVKDLSVTTREFTDEIKQQLQESRYLIVICSRNSAKSAFVQKEINYFLKTHNDQTDFVLPVFVDQTENSLPPALSKIEIQRRNCPIYNSKLTEKSEANLYCFYHIAAFLLKVDFTKLYNRYESYSKRKRRNSARLIAAFIVLLACSSIFLYLSLNRQRELTRQQEELTRFEKNIFPRSVVFGYEENFLLPAIEFLKDSNPSFGIYILMPYSVEDLKHQDRITSVGNRIRKNLPADSIYAQRLPTRMKRGTVLGRISAQDYNLGSVYVDFASTTSTFLKILNYKKEKYPSLNGNEVIQDYTNTFIRQTNELLGADSIYVHFYVSQDEFIEAIKKAGEIKTETDKNAKAPRP